MTAPLPASHPCPSLVSPCRVYVAPSRGGNGPSVIAQEWIKENKVLQIVLRDSLHQPQYVEKLEKIIR